MNDSLCSLTYNLGGRILEIASAEPALAHQTGSSIEALLTSRTQDPIYRLTVESGMPQPLPGILIYEGPVLDEGHGVYHQSGETYHFAFPGEVSLSLDPRHRAARIVVAPGCEKRLGETAGLLAIEAAIDAAGQQIMHAASLTLPGQDDVVIIHAPSGTGKTTTSLALAGVGFGLCSDDATVIEVTEDGIRAWGFPRDVKVHRKSAAMLPGISAVLGEQWDCNGEQPVSLDRLSSALSISPIRQRQVAGVFHLVRDGRQTASLGKIGQTDSLALLASDNVRAGSATLLPMQGRRFAALAALCSRVPVFEIRVGADPVEVAALVCRAMQRR